MKQTLEKMTVLFVDDQKSILTTLRLLFSKEPFGQHFVSSAEEALAFLAENTVHVIVTDMQMPGMDGLTLLDRVRHAYPHVVRMVLSGTDDRARIVKVINSGDVFRYLTKPLEAPLEAATAIRQALEYYTLQAQRRELLKDLEDRNRELKIWKTRVSRELDIAGKLQRRMVNQHPMAQDHYIVYKAYQPSSSVGGDVFDVISLPSGAQVLYVADVCGHGVASALVASMLQAVIADVIDHATTLQPSAICSEINHRFDHLVPDMEMYATLLFCCFDPKTGQGQILPCGHPAPLVVGPETMRVLDDPDKGGLPLGLLSAHEPPYRDEDVIPFALSRGETLLLYSDGLIESQKEHSEKMCGIDGLQHYATLACRGTWPGNPCQQVLKNMTRDGYLINQDDCSLVMLHYMGCPSHSFDRVIQVNSAAIEKTAEDVQRYLQESGWAADAAGYARLVVQEYGVNVIDHAPSTDAFSVRLIFQPGCCVLVFKDNGHEWDFDERLDGMDAKDELSEGGRGLLLIEGLSCYAGVSRVDGMNVGFVVMAQNRQLLNEDDNNE